MKKFYLLAIILLSSSIPALKAQTLDVNFTGTCTSSSPISGNIFPAQSFTNGITGFLTSVKVG